ncbi:glycerophosphodiester phosphodiesterase [Jiella pelagia]|uniref:Glycerophosphodiester phosphodiesterase family protein n=1 Tax=Jiella pelagia TaxID=2986949 RepID=A0ABY7BVA7_9HYPH|nr:glycerophosphodiester phosphodiesterase family protein [Jiella pelagia]WAP67739.1 glycerophosphodiester phosphodiesterase family protein [Jiella pelagia]
MSQPAATPPVSIIAHRGFSARHRENSPQAWHAAIEAGADFVEVDIRMTSDGVLVCSHDADLGRIAGRPEAIATTAAADLARIVVAGAAATPTLDELFATLPVEQPILFDVKDERPEALDRLVAAAGASGRDRLVFGLHEIPSVVSVRARSRDAILGLLPSPEQADAFFAGGGDILRLWESDATSQRLAAIAGSGHPVWVTTGHGETGRKVGDYHAQALRRMAADGASGFLVNDPLEARAALSQQMAETPA